MTQCAASRFLSDADPVLARVIEEVGPVRIDFDPEETIFEALATSIIYQQLHGKAAATILGRFKQLLSKGDNFPTPDQVLRARITTLAKAGLSRNKAAAIKDLAKRTKEGALPDRKQAEQMSDEDLIEAFTQVRGIGPWTAQMLLIFTLGRPDVWPTGDYGVRKGFALVHGHQDLPTPQTLLVAGEKWRPHRSAAAWYLWRALELPRFRGV